MKKEYLLKTICETAYNVGYGAKVNFATLDIVEKVPGLLGFISLAVGVYALIVPSLSTPDVGAAMVLVGIVALYVSSYDRDKQRYENTGNELTGLFNELKSLYRAAQSREDGDDLSDLVAQHEAIQAKTVGTSLAKQILFSDWFAHYKFFWQQQIDWLDEQKHFRFFRDKVPLTATLAAMAVLAGITWTLFRQLKIVACLLS